MSSTSRQFFTGDDLAMLDRVLGHANYPHSQDFVKREARLEATRFLITAFQKGVTSENELRASLADRAVVEASLAGDTEADSADRISAGRRHPLVPSAAPGGGYEYGKSVEIDGTSTVYHVFSGVPADYGALAMVDLNAKTAVRALKILNTAERAN